MKGTILALLFIGACVMPSVAADDTLLQAVGFALTGTDDAQVQVLDRGNCTFGLGAEIFHLNNVDTDRLFIGAVVNKATQEVFISVDLHGETTVYEATNQLKYDPQNEMDRALKQQRPEDFEPHHTASNQHTLNLPTRELTRVTRAWSYIYSHGCVGKKSPF